MYSKNKIQLPLLIIFALYINPVIIGGIQTLCYLVLYGIAAAYIALHSRYLINHYLRKINIKFALPVFWIFISLILSFVIPVLYNTNDFSYVNVILAVFRKTIIYVFLFMITSKKHSKEYAVDYFMLYYVLASILYVLGTIVLALIIPLRNIWQSFLHISDYMLSILSSYGYINRFGWAGFAGFRNTIDCTISLVFLIYLYASKESKIKVSTANFILGAFISFLGNMFYGRSGVIASTICLVVGLILYKKINLRVVVSALMVISIGIAAINILRERITAVNDWYIWITTPFYNFVTTGTFNNYSADRLFNEMIFMPSGKTLLFGDGRYFEAGTGAYYMHTDSGFMRQILFWGVGLTGVMYLCWFHCLSTIKRDFPIKLMLLIMCILFEIKGDVYYDLLPLFLIISMIDHTNLDKKNISSE